MQVQFFHTGYHGSHMLEAVRLYDGKQAKPVTLVSAKNTLASCNIQITQSIVKLIPYYIRN